ncbi:MAG: CapA family protein, partial [Candidatus Eisenbacteria bacterium]
MPNSRPLLALLLSAIAAAAPAAPRGTIIEDFESGSVVLESYPGQDEDPSSWAVTGANPYEGVYALRLHGNTWKVQHIPPIALTDSTVWRAAAFIERLGEMQAVGAGDSLNELFYTFAGEQLPQEPKWWTVYQGAFPRNEWYAYLLPIGRDWEATHGYIPTIDRLFYVNDDDEGTTGIVLFDAIADVTEDLPVPPEPSISYVVEKARPVAKNLFLVGVQFYANVFDPDSDTHTFFWDFGDGATSTDQNPVHDFLVEAHYTYTVGLLARDEDALVGTDTCQVHVEPGAGDLPITVNFVGDIFTGRGYEAQGGIIDTYGIEALFEPTLPIFGNAADVNVCNLECAYTDRGTPHPTKSVVFRSRPENIAGIEYAGVDVVTTGNNHIIDYGEAGMLQTLHLLDSLGVRHSGAGKNEYFALLPTFHTENGVRMAFLGQCNRCGRTWNYQPFLDAGASKPGFAYLLPHNVEAAVASARAAADIVIIQMHSGDEYDTEPPEKGWALHAPPPVEANTIGPDDPDFRFRVEPSPGDRVLRRLAADLGADAVINHHPHVLQGFESYNGKLIAHSLGNFIFDLYYPETMPTIVLTLEIDKEGIAGHTFVPAWIDDWIPRPATGTLGREITDRLADYSRPMGALVSALPDEAGARIYLDRIEADSTLIPAEAADSLFEANGARTTPPLRLAGEGNLSRVQSIAGPGSAWEVRWGREILWHGVFEEEGATFWDVNSSDEWIDSGLAHSG